MTAPTDELVRKHVLLDKSDWEWLELSFKHTVGASKALRIMLRRYRRQIEEKHNARARPITAIAAELGLDLEAKSGPPDATGGS